MILMKSVFGVCGPTVGYSIQILFLGLNLGCIFTMPIMGNLTLLGEMQISVHRLNGY